MQFTLSGAKANDSEPLSFEFIKHPPGELLSIESHRLHVHCAGEGAVTVLLEAGLGGSSLEWLPIQQGLSSRVRSCAYDRAGYAWSDPSPYARHARQIAYEADTLLSALEVEGPLILVAHSFGGFVARLLASQTQQNVIGMVLIETSHEEQLTQMENSAGTAMMPRSGSFVIKQSDVPDNLPADIKRKVLALGRMRKSYAATHGEMASFRESARQVRRARTTFDFPLAVMVRGKDPFRQPDAQADNKNTIWRTLQQDLVSLSRGGYAVVAEKSGHHVHVDQPQLVVETIEALIDEFEKN